MNHNFVQWTKTILRTDLFYCNTNLTHIFAGLLPTALSYMSWGLSEVAELRPREGVCLLGSLGLPSSGGPVYI